MQAFILINLLFLGFSEACTCGLATMQRVIHGQDVDAKTFPWIVSIGYLRPGDFASCTGSLIAPEYVLTAAHCLMSGGKGYVAVGRWVKDLILQQNFKELYTVASSVAFALLTEEDDFRNVDIGVIKLDRPVANAMPICLPTAGNDFANVQALLLGYGVRNQFDELGILKQGEMTVEATDACNKALEEVESEVYPREMCAGNVNGEAAECDGDSGGPLMYQDPESGRWLVIGLVLGSYGCFQTEIYGIFSRVNSYLDFIDSNSNNTGCKQQVEVLQQQCPCGEAPKGSNSNGTYPWLASFVTLDSSGNLLHTCGATMIASRYAVTAASCCITSKRVFIYLSLGSWGIDEYRKGQYESLKKINKVYRYGNGPETRNKDFALLELAEPVYVQAICLPVPKNDFAGLTGVSIGLGKYKEGEQPNGIRKENVTIIDDSDCTQSLEDTNNFVGDKEICGENKSESQNCGRNLGDPLMYFDSKSGNWVLIGIVAENTGCSTLGLFTKITSYLYWFDDLVKPCKRNTGN